MGQSATELKQEIAQTRQNLGETLDAIGDRVSPGRMVERRKNRMVRGFQNVRERVMGTASSMTDSMSSSAHGAVGSIEHSPEMVRERAAGNPMVAGAVAFGVGALVAAAIPPTRMERERASQIGEKLEPMKQEVMDTAKEVAQDLKEPAKEAVSEVRGAASEAAGEVRSTVSPGSGSGSSGGSTSGSTSSTPSPAQAALNRELDPPA